MRYGIVVPTVSVGLMIHIFIQSLGRITVTTSSFSFLLVNKLFVLNVSGVSHRDLVR
jgi:hypothetical protein